MFLFNRLKIDTIKDQTLLDKMKKWFNISSTNYASQPILLESKRRMLDELEIEKLESFEFDFNFSKNPVPRNPGKKMLNHSTGNRSILNVKSRCNRFVY